MDSFNINLNLTFLSSHLLILLLTICSTATATSSHVTLNPFEDIVCSLIECGQGTCKASNSSLLGFDCECKPGWRKIQIGPLTFPSCLIPNCTIDFHCGEGSTSPPSPPPPALLPPPSSQTNRCDFVWCGDGRCMTNGTGYSCQCNQGSVNLLNSSALACFKPCYLGADCQDLGIDLPTGHPQPPPPTPPPPPPPPSGGLGSDNGNGLKGMSKYLGSVMVVVTAAFLSGF